MEEDEDTSKGIPDWVLLEYKVKIVTALARRLNRFAVEYTTET